MESVFLIAPIEKDDQYKEKTESFMIACKEIGCVPSHALDFDRKNSKASSSTLKQFHSIDLFIVDLSHERPSCYFEMGFAEGLNKNVVLIAEEGTTIHQTKMNKVFFYSDTGAHAELIRDILDTYTK